MKKLITSTVFLCFQLTIFSQPVTESNIVYQVPEMQDVVVKEDIIYKGEGEMALNFDLYYPANYPNGKALPIVLFANGARRDSPDWLVYQDWARLMAAKGMAAINYQADRPTALADLDDLVTYLQKNASALKIDPLSIGLWAASGNATFIHPWLMDESKKFIRCAVFYYGLAADYKKLRYDLPLQLVRAGKDIFSLNKKIDEFLPYAMEKEIPLEFINYVKGYHAFDVLNDTDESRRIIQQTIDFLQTHLFKEQTDTKDKFVLTTRNFYKMIIDDETEKAIQLMRAYKEKYANEDKRNRGYHRVASINSLNQIGYQLLEDKKLEEAIKVFQLNIEFNSHSPNTYDSLADAYEANGETDKAIEYAQLTLEKLKTADYLSERSKENIRKAATDKINRLTKD